MKRYAMLPLLLLLALGCKKTMDKLADDAKPGADEKPQLIPKGSGDLSGGGGAAQAVRNAAARTANDVELNDLKLAIATAAADDGKPPSAERIKEEVRQNGKLTALIKDEVIILTNTQKKDGIWAYTKWPQRAGKHYVITAVGREEKTPAELTEALKAQGTEAHLEK
jgi:hypothetical protein